MFTSKSTDHLAFISRQISNLLDDHQLETALQRLSEASPAEYSKDIEYFRNLLASTGEKGPSLGPNPYQTLSKLMPAVSDLKNAFFRGFVEYVQQRKIVFETYWAGVIGLIWYLAALSVVALVVAVVFGVFVIPSFNAMFSQFGAPLPALTTAVFTFGRAGLPVFAIGLTVVIGLVVWFTTMFHRRIQQLAPLPRWPTWAPLVGKISGSYNLGLFLNFARLLRQSDVAPTSAVSVAAAQSNQAGDLSYESLANVDGDFGDFPALTQLAVAARLGHFDRELVHQCDQHLGRLAVSLVEVRDRFSLVLKLALYFFVATLVVAMYLPIFKLGSVI